MSITTTERTLSPLEAYKKLVFDQAAEIDSDLLAEVGKFAADFQRDKETFAARQHAIKELAAAELTSREADELENKLATAAAGDQLVSDFRTVLELAEVLAGYRQAAMPGFVDKDRVRIHDLRMAARDTRNQALQILVRTADTAITQKVTPLLHKIQALKQMIANRADRLPQAIAAKKAGIAAKIERLVDDRRDINDDHNKSVRVLLGEAREELRRLTANEVDGPRAVRENEADQQQIASLVGQCQELEKSKLVLKTCNGLNDCGRR